MDFITSDLHFCHTNILKFNPRTRQHNSVETMNEFLIKDWNSKVAPFSDTVFILGDFCFGSVDKAVSILKRLNGKKILISGNHDVKLIKEARFRDEFESIQNYLEINRDKIRISMMHYPLLEWNGSHRENSVMLHGHCHGNIDNSKCRRVDVGVDAFCNGSAVVELDSVIKHALSKPLTAHHGEYRE